VPIYAYHCTDCGGFDAMRAVAQRDDPCACPGCSAPAARTISAPRLATMDAIQRRALGVNERASHEPKSSGAYPRLKHPPGCGCCAPGRSRSTVVMPNGNKTFIDRRPWMISH
jgi:putative FmdB family regulatory protein